MAFDLWLMNLKYCSCKTFGFYADVWIKTFNRVSSTQKKKQKKNTFHEVDSLSASNGIAKTPGRAEGYGREKHKQSAAKMRRGKEKWIQSNEERRPGRIRGSEKEGARCFCQARVKPANVLALVKKVSLRVTLSCFSLKHNSFLLLCLSLLSPRLCVDQHKHAINMLSVRLPERVGQDTTSRQALNWDWQPNPKCLLVGGKRKKRGNNETT